MRPTPFPSSSLQPARLLLQLSEHEPTSVLAAQVLRISPLGLRLAIRLRVNFHPRVVLRLNPIIEVELPLPDPLGTRRTRAALVGVGINDSSQEYSAIFDCHFMDMSAEEEKALRDSNPHLIVA